MSKLIETLRASAQEFTKRQTKDSTVSNAQKTQYELTQEQLADIYFSNTQKTQKSEMPMVIKVIEKSKPSASIGPWIISLIAIIITAFSLFSSKRVFVDIKVIDDRAMYAPSSYDSSIYGRGDVSRSAPRNLSPADFWFEGAALLKSSKSKDLLTLSNSSVASFAKAATSFEPPLNLTTSKLCFMVKGVKGQENIAVAMKDRENRTAFPKGKFYPYPTGLTNDWQRVEISSQDFLSEFDSKNITGLRFEFGTKEIGNKPGDSILIKDLHIETP